MLLERWFVNYDMFKKETIDDSGESVSLFVFLREMDIRWARQGWVYKSVQVRLIKMGGVWGLQRSIA
jgi:hypothetical protein